MTNSFRTDLIAAVLDLVGAMNTDERARFFEDVRRRFCLGCGIDQGKLGRPCHCQKDE